jgi:pimeloyl-ACP methyl ester carboxylesterase
LPIQSINGFDLSYTETGTGPTLVLLHGFPLDARAWHGVADLLASRFRVIMPDLRGFGASASDAPFTIESLADDVFAFLQAKNLGGVILGGLSMGGYVALAFAKKYPQALRGLLLVDTTASGDSIDGKAGRMKRIETVKTGGSRAVAEQMFPKMITEQTIREKPAVVHLLREIMNACPPTTIEHALLAMRDREDFTAMLPSITVPSLVIVGKDDAIIPLDVAYAVASAIGHGTMVVIPSAGHMAPLEQPQAVADAIARFFTSAQ